MMSRMLFPAVNVTILNPKIPKKLWFPESFLRSLQKKLGRSLAGIVYG